MDRMLASDLGRWMQRLSDYLICEPSKTLVHRREGEGAFRETFYSVLADQSCNHRDEHGGVLKVPRSLAHAILRINNG